MNEKLLEERGAHYGPFDGNAMISQRLKFVLHGTPSWGRLNLTQREALELICVKISRIIGGDPDYVDSWRDIGGYAQLAINSIEGQK